MQRRFTTLALALAALTASSAISAKTLVYCSEGSPENFNPQLYTSGTSVDASAVPVYNRLVDFKAGTTELVPEPRRKLGSQRRGKVYTFIYAKALNSRVINILNPAAILMPTTLFFRLCGKKILTILIIISPAAITPILKASNLAS